MAAGVCLVCFGVAAPSAGAASTTVPMPHHSMVSAGVSVSPDGPHTPEGDFATYVPGAEYSGTARTGSFVGIATGIGQT